ncbi:hypothetical protein E4T56_gene3803, partial [Termitomyces sp. T112]
AGLIAAQHVGFNADRFGKPAPFGPGFQLLVIVADIEEAAAGKARLLARIGAKLLPQAKALGGNGQFTRIAVLLTAPAPVAARLFAAHNPLLDQRDLQPAFGQIIGGKAARYARADEYVGIMRRIWESPAPINHEGRFYRFNQAFSPVKPGAIPVSWAGTSPESIAACGRHADLFAMSGDTLAHIAGHRDRVLAAAHGRPMDFMMTVLVILGETEAQAWEKADTILQDFRAMMARLPAAQGPSNFAQASHAGEAILSSAQSAHRHDRCLWLGVTHLAQGRFGNQAALVGTPDQDHIDTYARDGVVVLRGLLDADWIARMQAAIARVSADPGRYGMLGPSNGAMLSVCYLWRNDPDFRAFVMESPIAEATGRVIGADYIRMYHDHLFSKPPLSPSIMPWHCDETAWPVSGEMAPNIWTAFTPVNKENGRSEYVEGWHRH